MYGRILTGLNMTQEKETKIYSVSIALLDPLDPSEITQFIIKEFESKNTATSNNNLASLNSLQSVPSNGPCVAANFLFFNQLPTVLKQKIVNYLSVKEVGLFAPASTRSHTLAISENLAFKHILAARKGLKILDWSLDKVDTFSRYLYKFNKDEKKHLLILLGQGVIPLETIVTLDFLVFGHY